ncbi:MAG: hypothetical protein V4773_22745 [Verrucomicrobiota bacterium]
MKPAPSHPLRPLLVFLAALCLGAGVFSLSGSSAHAAVVPHAAAEVETVEIVQALVARDGDYLQRSYLVEWKGVPVVVEDPLIRVPYETGAPLRMNISKRPYPRAAKSHGLMNFTVVRQTPKDAKPTITSDPIDKAENLRAERIEVRVKRVLTAQDESFKYRGYTVEWDGKEAYVRDSLAQTNYKVGARIPVILMRLAHPDPLVATGLLGMTVAPR